MSDLDLVRIANRPVGPVVRASTLSPPIPGRHVPGAGILSWTRSTLRDFGYLSTVSVWSVVGLSVLVGGVSVTASLLFLVFGVVVWVGFGYLMRWTTWVDRRLAGWQRGEPVPAVYRRPPARGLLPMLRTVTSDPQTWRDLGWLGLTSIVGFALGLAVITLAGVVLAYISLPAWYWTIANPAGRYGVTNFGAFTVDTLPEALVLTAAGLVLTPLVVILARWAAATHAGLAARILGPMS